MHLALNEDPRPCFSQKARRGAPHPCSHWQQPSRALPGVLICVPTIEALCAKATSDSHDWTKLAIYRPQRIKLNWPGNMPRQLLFWNAWTHPTDFRATAWNRLLGYHARRILVEQAAQRDHGRLLPGNLFSRSDHRLEQGSAAARAVWRAALRMHAYLGAGSPTHMAPMGWASLKATQYLLFRTGWPCALRSTRPCRAIDLARSEPQRRPPL